MAYLQQKPGLGEVRVNWTALLGLAAVVALSVGAWGAAIKAGIALLVR